MLAPIGILTPHSLGASVKKVRIDGKEKPQPVSRFLAGAKFGTYHRKRLAAMEPVACQLHQTEKFLRVDDGHMKNPASVERLAGAKSAPAGAWRSRRG